MSAVFQHVLVEQDNGVLFLTLNRPEVLNAFNEQMLKETIEVCEQAAHDETVRCIVLRGAGRGFSAGQDLAALASATTGQSEPAIREHLQKYHHLVQLLQQMPRPVIAVLHGVATGISLNIALACDLRIATEDVRISQGFARIGLVPDGGGAYFLPRLVGLGKALELALLAEEITGREAERIGLVNTCVPAADLDHAVLTLAHRLAAGPTSTYTLIKGLFHTAVDASLQDVFVLESEAQEQALRTADHKEGIAAFLQKRKPAFKGY